jgi:hypothetical protein
MAVGGCSGGGDYSPHGGQGAESKMGLRTSYNLQMYATCDLLAPNRPHLLNFQNLLKKYHQLEAKHSTHEPVGTLHIQTINLGRPT